MAAREQMGTNIEPGLIQRVIQGVRYAVTGVGPMNFFGPAQPLEPQAQDKTEGRAFDYPVAYNLRMQPRAGEAISFADLRGIADGYDLLRLAIETRKDQIESYQWEIIPRDPKDSAAGQQDKIRQVTDFMSSPDKEHHWPQWIRMQIEDLLVLDAIAVYPRANRGGGLYALELIDPATLKRVLDDGGRTPMAPDPAYQQILKGIPAADYSRDQLVYAMRNPRTNRVYGYSPVEQVLMTVNIALRRQMSQLSAYTEGNVPEALAQVPSSWTASQTREFQTWWDSVMEGNSGARRKMRFIPSLDNIVFPRAAVLKDEYDEWLARIICFAFSLSPSALVKQVNRASGEQMADTAKEEGLLPLLRFLEAHLSLLIQRYLGAPDLRFVFKLSNKVDAKEQAEIHRTYHDIKALTPDEIREDLGRERLTPEQREAAWPKPAMEPDANLDGAPKQAANDEPPFGEKQPKEEPEEETRAEKLFAKALDLMDPARVADALTKTIAALPAPAPVHVQAGDTFVTVPTQAPPVVKFYAEAETKIMSPPAPTTKHVSAQRDPKTGGFIGKVETVGDHMATVVPITDALVMFKR